MKQMKITKKDIVFPKHKKTSHKGENGKVLIIGGSETYVGCLVLAGLAALRSGADVVTIAAPEKVSYAINSYSPDLITKKFNGKYFGPRHVKEILALIKEHNAILIGIGIGQNIHTKLFLKKLIQNLKNSKKPVVIDADAIKLISLRQIENAILTPHKKEFEILLKNTKITEKDLKKYIRNNIIVKKGPTDKIITKNKIYTNSTGNESMTKAGTGDVLAGLIVGFLAQNVPNIKSTIIAAYINGKIGEYLKRKKGYSYIASDLIKDYESVVKKEVTGGS